MTVEEMINFNTQECVNLLRQETEAKIINGIYTVSLKSGVELNEEEIKKMLLMFKPMQKELKIYKKALEQACNDIYYERCNACRLVDDCDDCNNSYDYVNEYLQKAREQE